MSANIIQYDLFKSKEESEIDSLRRYCDETQAMSHRVRKGLYAENGTLKKRMMELESRMEIIEVQLCKSV